jgi:ribosome maturation factor RimP
MYTDVLQLEEDLDKLLYDFGFQVVDLVIAGRTPNRVFRLFIDRVDGGPVTLGDCSAVARQLSLYLESRELFDPATCSLEVSSPGLDRVLKRPRDFERYLGHEVRVTHHDQVRKETVTGELSSFTDDQLLIALPGADGAVASRAIRLDSVDKVSLVPKLELKR